MKVAWLFPGQGSQKVSMGRDVVERFESARETFAKADSAVPIPLERLCFEGPEAELTRTSNLQPCLVATSSALVHALRERYPALPEPAYAAGHSLGEYSALVATCALSIEQAVRIVHERGTAMQAAVPEGDGAMLAVIGGDESAVAELCAAARGDDVLSPANYNCPGQIVVAGHKQAVDRARTLTKERGLKGVPLKVSAPFHCALMRPATKRMRSVLSDVVFQVPACPVVSNVEAKGNADATRIGELLLRQIESAVRWEQSLRWMVEQGVTHALEIGPGKVLSGLVKKTEPNLPVLNVADAEGIEAVEDFLESGA